MDGKFKNNKGLQTAMALDTLGNAYCHLREQASSAIFNSEVNSEEWVGLIMAARIIRQSFNRTRNDFKIMDFTEGVKS